MDRNLDTIHEHEPVPITSSSDTTGDDLPTVTPKQRSFADTVNKQNRENKALREQILRDKIKQLEQQLYATEQALDYNANDPNGRRTPSQQNPVLSMLVPPFSPRTHSQGSSTPRRRVPRSPKAKTSNRTRDNGLTWWISVWKRCPKTLLKTRAGTYRNNSDVSTPPHFSGYIRWSLTVPCQFSYSIVVSLKCDWDP